LSAIGENLLGNAKDLLGEIDISTFTDFDASALLENAEEVIEIAQEYAAEAFEAIGSFW